jgi:hypothetical protein
MLIVLHMMVIANVTEKDTVLFVMYGDLFHGICLKYGVPESKPLAGFI